ncbi:HAD-IIB family hydrolase [Rhodobaculum claviforme]|uniref:Alpha,alpha-trehalose-phosphate synthase n=1 Tax=Rhodobaculum claviforme TaxID=1549854 RepID=A0A934WIK0_9RHOB|nr:HAD-IIB family hydrolase [Rhodobaculum claviforme]MBK5926822.1 alpha,alpha-trehalose-phosphate synthase [Rhodobaculum claviforme]
MKDTRPADWRFVLATDLDGTFLGGTPDMRRCLYDWIDGNRHEVGLIYVTGRDPAFLPTIWDEGVPVPDYVVGDVGTTIAQVQGRVIAPIPALEADIAARWGDRADTVRALLAGAPGLREQDTPFRYRMSYHYDPAAFDPAVIPPVEALGLDVLISHECYLDVLPGGVSKGPSLLRLMDHLGLAQGRVLVAGDTLNDLSMFQTGLAGAVVGGSEPALLAAARDLPRAHVCTAPGAGGILEAIAAHRLHPASPPVPSEVHP